MSSVMQPVGPQQPGVYWFRRGLLLLVLVLILAGIGYMLVGRGSGGTPVVAPSSSTSPSATASATASATPSATPSSTTRPQPSASKGVARTCTNSDISVVASTDNASYVVGATPKLQMRISNSSATACRRGVGSGPNELIVYLGAIRFWSSNDCTPGGPDGVVTIGPGESYSVSVTWAGIGSAPNCPANPPQASAGDYSLVGVNRDERSKASPFTLTTAAG